MKYNEENNITPTQIVKASKSIMGRPVSQVTGDKYYVEPQEMDYAADLLLQYMDEDSLKKTIEKTKRDMEKAARNHDFIEAARLRDEMFKLQEILEKQKDQKET